MFGNFFFRCVHQEPIGKIIHRGGTMTLDLSSLKKAVNSLETALGFAASKDQLAGLTKDQKDVIRAGAIQNFEFTYELCWKFMKRWLENNLGSAYVDGIPRKELFRIAAEHQLITSVNHWIKYHDARNETAHTYDEDKAREVFEAAKKFLTDARELLQNLEVKND